MVYANNENPMPKKTPGESLVIIATTPETKKSIPNNNKTLGIARQNDLLLNLCLRGLIIND